MSSTANFIFVVCQPTSSPWLKAELLRSHPKLRFAFSRPGLMTFKSETPLSSGFALKTPLIRVWGHSIGRATSAREVLELLAQAGLPPPLRLHVFERDPKDLEALGAGVSQLGTRAEAIKQQVLDAGSRYFHSSPVAEPGDRVIDVVAAPSTEPEEPWLIGWHRHEPGMSPLPGGPTRILPPPDAPSRAWSKIEEALAWSGIEMRAGQTAVEIGCAPGGVAWALLQRGIEVVGIDPGEMDPRVLSFVGPSGNRFRHIQQPVGAVGRADLPARADWLLSDVNLAPPVALRYVGWIVDALRPGLKGIVLTLKLNDDRMRAAIPKLLERVREFKLGEPRTTQLPSNRSEVTVVATRSRS